MAVPTELNNGVNAPVNLDNPLNQFCVLYGTNRPFTAEEEDGLYRSDAEHRLKVLAQLVRLARHGFVLARDIPALYREAIARDIVD